MFVYNLLWYIVPTLVYLDQFCHISGKEKRSSASVNYLLLPAWVLTAWVLTALHTNGPEPGSSSINSSLQSGAIRSRSSLETWQTKKFANWSRGGIRDSALLSPLLRSISRHYRQLPIRLPRYIVWYLHTCIHLHTYIHTCTRLHMLH